MKHLALVCEDRGIPVDGSKGSSIHVRSMARAFALSGAIVDLLSPRPGSGRWAQGLPVNLVSLGAEPEAASRDEGGRPADPTGVILDRIHAVHHLDMVYERLSLNAPGASAWCKARGVPHVVEVNAPLAHEASIFRRLSDVERASQIETRLLKDADLLLPVSPWLSRWVEGLGCDPSRIRLMPNAVDESWLRSEPVPSPARNHHRVHVGFVGSLRPWHGVELLLDAVDRLPADQFRLTIVGDGPSGPWLRERLDSRNPTDVPVEWHGAVPFDAVRDRIDAMDCCVAPYAEVQSFYFCPIKIFEYGARQRPVIVPDRAELTEQFPPGSLLTFRQGCAEDLARSLLRFRDDRALGLQCATRLREFVAGRTWASNVRVIWEALEACPGPMGAGCHEQ